MRRQEGPKRGPESHGEAKSDETSGQEREESGEFPPHRIDREERADNGPIGGTNPMKPGQSVDKTAVGRRPSDREKTLRQVVPSGRTTIVPSVVVVGIVGVAVDLGVHPTRVGGYVVVGEGVSQNGGSTRKVRKGQK